MRIAPDTVACVVGLGGNLGDVAATLRAAFQHWTLPSTRLVRASGLYRTPAWGVTAQADFINAVALLDTALPARALLDALLAIERACGRDREAGDARAGDRARWTWTCCCTARHASTSPA